MLSPALRPAAKKASLNAGGKNLSAGLEDYKYADDPADDDFM
jgi:hypothetical protein